MANLNQTGPPGQGQAAERGANLNVTGPPTDQATGSGPNLNETGPPMNTPLASLRARRRALMRPRSRRTPDPKQPL